MRMYDIIARKRDGFAHTREELEFLIHGFEMWCRKKLCGERHDKWWLKDQLGRNFANRQGDVSYMGDRENGKNANISGAKH